MNSFFLIVFLTALICNQALSEHPFVGKHANASSHTYEDGSFALRMTKQPAQAPNKYSKFIDRQKTYGPPQSTTNPFVLNWLKEQVFGKDVSTEKLQEGIAQYLVKNQNQMAKHRKLGQRNVGVALETADGSIWTGKVYMGRYTPLDVIFDTGSDWLVVESHECSNCEGNTYDTSQSKRVEIRCWV